MTAARRDARLDEAFVHCEGITRARARNFYYGLKLTPPAQRGAMYAVYAWMRQADDLADAAGLEDHERRRRIAMLRERTRRLFDEAGSGGGSGVSAGVDSERGLADPSSSADPVWIAMADTVRRFRLSIDPFESMLDGQLEDVEHREYRTFEDLRGFCYRVASTVGLVCITIWGYRDPRARELAIDRGIAFQLTNILRDVHEDFARGRVYLPAEDFERHGLTPEQLMAWGHGSVGGERCRRFILEQAERVEQYYRRSAELDAMIDPGCRPTLWAMSTIYHGLLGKIVAHPSAVVGSRRIRLSCVTKGLIAWRARRQAAAAMQDPMVAEAWRAGTS